MDSSFHRNDLENGRVLLNHRVNKGFNSIVRLMTTFKEAPSLLKIPSIGAVAGMGWGWVNKDGMPIVVGASDPAIPSTAAKSGNDGRDCFARVLLLLLTYCGAPVPRYDSTFHLELSEVRAKHFRQKAANSKNLTLCNQKHRLFLCLLGKCFAPTSIGRITREPDAN